MEEIWEKWPKKKTLEIKVLTEHGLGLQYIGIQQESENNKLLSLPLKSVSKSSEVQEKPRGINVKKKESIINRTGSF